MLIHSIVQKQTKWERNTLMETTTGIQIATLLGLKTNEVTSTKWSWSHIEVKSSCLIAAKFEMRYLHGNLFSRQWKRVCVDTGLNFTRQNQGHSNLDIQRFGYHQLVFYINCIGEYQ